MEFFGIFWNSSDFFSKCLEFYGIFGYFSGIFGIFGILNFWNFLDFFEKFLEFRIKLYKGQSSPLLRLERIGRRIVMG